MADYDTIDKYYDLMMGSRLESARRVRRLLRERHPRARTLLDLACGSGAILKHLARHYDAAGLDLSSVLLAMARKKLPQPPLLQGDMKSFDVGRTFDVIVCLLDSANHLRTFGDWQRVFARVHRHLNRGGLFVFDIHTERKLARLASSGPRVHEFRGHVMIIDVSSQRNGRTAWHLKVFEPLPGAFYRCAEETIYERSFPLPRIRTALREAGFAAIETFDPDRERITARSERVYFRARRG